MLVLLLWLISRLINRSGLRISHSKVPIWRLITRGEQALFNLEIRKKRRSSIDLNISHSKVFSSVFIAPLIAQLLRKTKLKIKFLLYNRIYLFFLIFVRKNKTSLQGEGFHEYHCKSRKHFLCVRHKLFCLSNHCCIINN